MKVSSQHVNLPQRLMNSVSPHCSEKETKDYRVLSNCSRWQSKCVSIMLEAKKCWLHNFSESKYSYIGLMCVLCYCGMCLFAFCNLILFYINIFPFITPLIHAIMFSNTNFNILHLLTLTHPLTNLFLIFHLFQLLYKENHTVFDDWVIFILMIYFVLHFWDSLTL